MRLSPQALGLTLCVLWGGAILTIGSANQFCPGYGADVLEMLSEIYPGFSDPEDVSGFGNVVVGALWGLADGFLAGALIAWLYNKFAGA